MKSVPCSFVRVLVLTTALLLSPGAHAQPCVPVVSNLVGWWRAEGNALDQSGINNGAAEGEVGFDGGKVGQAFSFNGTNAAVRMPASASLNVGPGDGFTIEGWIKPS